MKDEVKLAHEYAAENHEYTWKATPPGKDFYYYTCSDEMKLIDAVLFGYKANQREVNRWRSLAEQRLRRIEELEKTIRLQLDELPDDINPNEWVAVLADEVEKGWYVTSPSGNIEKVWYDPDDDNSSPYLDETRLCLKPRRKNEDS